MTGRFIVKDVWPGDDRQPQTLDPYLYVLDNPIRYVDPSGYQIYKPILQWLRDEIAACHNASDYECVWRGYWTIAFLGQVVTPHASDHMFQFLFKRGDITYDRASEFAFWLTTNPSVKKAQEVAENDLLAVIHVKGKAGELNGRAKTIPRLVIPPIQEVDLYYAMFRFHLWAEADYNITLDAACCYEVEARPEYHFHDTYDWHKGWTAGGSLPVIQGFEDAWTAALQDADLAKGYEISGYFTNIPSKRIYTFPEDWLKMNTTPQPVSVKPVQR